MAEVDRCLSTPEEFTDYRRGFLQAVGTPDDQVDRGAAALATRADQRRLAPADPRGGRRGPRAWRRPASGWPSPATPTARSRTSCAPTASPRSGAGAGVAVEVVTDSGVLGVAKPDPAMFLATAEGLGLAPEHVLHVGDGGYYDAEGARGVGMVGVHVDPLGLCPDERHGHVASLSDLAGHLVAAGPAGAGRSRPAPARD